MQRIVLYVPTLTLPVGVFEVSSLRPHLTQVSQGLLMICTFLESKRPPMDFSIHQNIGLFPGEGTEKSGGRICMLARILASGSNQSIPVPKIQFIIAIITLRPFEAFIKCPAGVRFWIVSASYWIEEPVLNPGLQVFEHINVWPWKTTVRWSRPSQWICRGKYCRAYRYLLWVGQKSKLSARTNKLPPTSRIYTTQKICQATLHCKDHPTYLHS